MSASLASARAPRSFAVLASDADGGPRARPAGTRPLPPPTTSGRCARSGCSARRTPFNHAQAALLPLVYLAIIAEFGVTRRRDRLPGRGRQRRVRADPVHLRRLTRFVSRRTILTVGGLVFGGGMALQALAAELRHVRRGQHRVARRRLAAAPGRQRPARRAVSAAAPRLRHLRPHRRRQRRHGLRAAARGVAHRRHRLALDGRAVRRAGDDRGAGDLRLRARVGRRSCRGPRLRHAPFGARRRGPRPQPAARLCSRRCSAAAAAAWAC